MKNVLLIVLILIATRTRAQDRYITALGDTIKIGDTVYVGKGSMPNGKYRYIDGIFGPGEGEKLIVNKFIKHPNTDAVTVKLYIGGIAYLKANIDYALDAKEILLKAHPAGRIIH